MLALQRRGEVGIDLGARRPEQALVGGAVEVGEPDRPLAAELRLADEEGVRLAGVQREGLAPVWRGLVEERVEVEDRVDLADLCGDRRVGEVAVDDPEARLRPRPLAQRVGSLVDEDTRRALADGIERIAAVDVPDPAEVGEGGKGQELGRVVDQLELRGVEVHERRRTAKPSANGGHDPLSQVAHRRRA